MKTLYFDCSISDENLKELTDKYGDNTSESLYVEVKDNNGNKKSNNIFVVDSKNYVRFVDNKDKFIEINNDEGIYVTYKLAETEGYKIGDEITWHISGNNTYYTSKIVGFNKDPQNQNITMTRKYLESLNIQYKPDSLYTDVDLSDTKEIDNLGILSYTEKQYQFSTLKVLGFKNKQIKKIFVKQNNIIAVISIILGLPAGFFLADWLFKTAIKDSYDFGAHINIETYIIAAVGTFMISYIVSKIIAKKVDKIDMVTSLKGNE